MRAADRAVRPTCNARKRLSLQHMRLLLHRSATVHTNDSPASAGSDATTKVGSNVVRSAAKKRLSATSRTNDSLTPQPRARTVRNDTAVHARSLDSTAAPRWGWMTVRDSVILVAKQRQCHVRSRRPATQRLSDTHGRGVHPAKRVSTVRARIRSPRTATER